ncbi:MAG: phosphoglycerate kinase [Patescibacteria group bacterium]
MQNIKKIQNIKGKKILMRVDFNEPIINGKLENDFRIKKTLPTIKFLSEKGAKIILISHLGNGEASLDLIAKDLNKFMPQLNATVSIKFIPEIIGPKVEEEILKMQNGEIILLENLRKNKGEQDCDRNFARQLANLADIYVNEAFPVSHREDASIILLPKLLPSYAGLQLEAEVKNLSKVFGLSPVSVSRTSTHPFLFILGGAKFSTKIPLVKKYLKLADFVFIGGALANNFFKENNLEIGKSLIDKLVVVPKNILKNKKIILPEDVLTTTDLSRLTKSFLKSKKINEIEENEYIIDIGNNSTKKLIELIKKSKLIVWNGPLSKSEGEETNNKKIIDFLLSQKNKKIIIGGGDLINCLPDSYLNSKSQLNATKSQPKNIFISTGGGATLEFLTKNTLPGIKALN